jgi:uncharacterized protein (DUF1778 family)
MTASTQFQAEKLQADLLKQAAGLVSDSRVQVEIVLCGAMDNARDTIVLQKAAADDQWLSLFKGSMETILACGDVPANVIAWFARRGIAA